MNTLIKPILLWAMVTFMLAMAFSDGATGAFPDGLPEPQFASQAEDISPKIPEKTAKKILKKPKNLYS